MLFANGIALPSRSTFYSTSLTSFFCAKSISFMCSLRRTENFSEGNNLVQANSSFGCFLNLIFKYNLIRSHCACMPNSNLKFASLHIWASKFH